MQIACWVTVRGAPAANLAHNASFHSRERISPSNHGIKQLVYHVMGDVAEGRRNADGLPFPTARHFSAAVSAPMHAAALAWRARSIRSLNKSDIQINRID
jgi:hypothetical protein